MINESADFFGGTAVQQQETPAEPVMEDSLAYGHMLDSLPQPEATHVAGIGTALGRIISRPVAKAVRGVLPSPVQAGMAADKALLDDALRTMANERTKGAQARRVDLEAQRQGGTPPVPIAEGAPSPRAVTGTSGEINLERAHPGAPAQSYVELADKAGQDPGAMLRLVRTADEMGDMLDVIGEGMHEAPRTHASIRAEGFDYNAVAQALTQDGLANDRQLFALRSMVATLGEKAALLAREIYQGNHAPDKLLEYEKTVQQVIAFVNFTKGQTREVARALSQQNMVADTLEGNDLRAITGALNTVTGGDPEALIKSATALKMQLDAGVDPAIAFQGALERHTPFEAFIEFWKANNLSGLGTQVYNLASAPVVMFAEMSARIMAAGFGETRHALGVGSPEYYSARELTESLIGGFNGLYNSLGFFWHTLKTGESQMGAYGGKEVGSSAIYEQFSSPNGFLGRFGMDMSPGTSEAVTTPAFRVMKAIDDAMMLPGYMAELSSLATRDGIERGLSGADLAKHIDDTVMNPSYAMQQDALEHARKVVMQASAADEYNAGFFTRVGEQVHQLAKSIPVLQFVLPWIKTPSRILDYSIESSALAVAHSGIRKALVEGGARGDIAAAKVTLGASISVMTVPLVISGRITGEGPEDPEQRAALERKGWKPFSFKVGDTYVSYRNWADPVVGLVAGIATGIERMRYARRDVDIAREGAAMIGAMFEYMLEASYMEGLKNFFDATRSDGTWAQYVSSLAQGVTPYSGALASAARIQDATDRSRSRVKSPGFGGVEYVGDLFRQVQQDFFIRFPGLRDGLRPSRYWDGDVKAPEGPTAVRHLLPMRSVQGDAASDELIKYGVKVGEPASRFDFGTKLIQIELLDLDEGRGLIYDQYIRAVGEERRTAVEIIINTYEYKNAEPGIKGLMLDRAIAAGRQAGTARFWEEYLLPIIQSGHPGLEKSGREQGMTLQEFVGLLLTKEFSRAIVPMSRREIALPPELEFK